MLCLALSLSILPDRAAAQSPPPRFLIGACGHLAQHVPYPAANLALMAQAGLRSLRDEPAWGAVEQRKGELAMPAKYQDFINTALADKIEPLLILDYGNALYDRGDKPRSDEAIAAFTRYAEFVARHFQGKVHYYEVWNEWSNGGGHTTPGSVEDYARLLKAVYPVLKRVDPGITVLADEVMLWHGRTIDGAKAGELDLMPFLDGISVHPYQKTPEASIRQMAELEAAARHANKDKPVPLYATEIGWPVYGKGVSLTRQAAYAARLLLLARTLPFLDGVWWYDFRNDGQDPGSDYPNYGLVWQDLTPKPAYAAVADIAALLAEATPVDRVATADDDDWVLRFRTAGGEDVWALWTTKDGALARFGLTTLATSPGPVEIHEAGHGPATRGWVADPHGHGVSRLDVTVGETPVLIRGKLDGVSVGRPDHPPFPSELR
jgi:polysaccharide biosynthesis protein PslG